MPADFLKIVEVYDLLHPRQRGKRRLAANLFGDEAGGIGAVETLWNLKAIERIGMENVGFELLDCGVNVHFGPRILAFLLRMRRG